MDNLHSGLRDIADHHDEFVVPAGASSLRPFAIKASKPASQPTTARSGWYHDAAIEASAREAIEARSNPYHH